MGTVIAAVVAAMVALTAAYLVNFVAEDYRRFRDGSALASALAGELNSYQPAFQQLFEALGVALHLLAQGKREELAFRKMERPRDLIYEANVPKLGLLSSDLTSELVFVYGNINGFRMGFELVNNEHASMGAAELRGRLQSAQAALDAAQRRESRW